jgi:hypothetical protein
VRRREWLRTTRTRHSDEVSFPCKKLWGTHCLRVCHTFLQQIPAEFAPIGNPSRKDVSRTESVVVFQKDDEQFIVFQGRRLSQRLRAQLSELVLLFSYLLLLFCPMV